MDSVSLLLEQIRSAHEVAQATVADLTPDQAHWKPAGKAIAAGPLLFHTAGGEDFFLNMVVGRQPLANGAYANKTGASEPQPMAGGYDEWAGRVKLDLPQLNEYVQAVFKSTEAYVAGLKSEDLARELDLTNVGLGKMSLAAFITLTAVIHPSNHIGEISCLKGLQGAKGYPF
jgi:uncharacterized damage-inducible protein DinB